ncbi:MAG: energy transducer TonB, partial [Candidatus Omnitrophica bacterium]|nr:energy transducer TonB [Candidatus Omnitrophota bacterium]
AAPVFSEDEIKDPVVRYARIVQKKILDNLVYPEAAKDAGFQGKLKLSLKLSAQGELLDSKIKEPSGYRLLDNNAVKVAKKISPYPPFPPAIKESQLWVDVPIIYQLE